MFIQEFNTIQSAGNKKEKSVQFSPKEVWFLQWLDLHCVNEFCMCHFFKSTLSVKIMKILLPSVDCYVSWQQICAGRSCACPPEWIPYWVFTGTFVPLWWTWHGQIWCSMRGESGFLAKHETVHLWLEWIRFLCVSARYDNQWKVLFLEYRVNATCLHANS